MTPQERPASAPQQQQQQQQPSALRAQLTVKLFLMESARSTLEQELRNFTNQAYEEVHPVLNSSLPISVFTDLTEALDVKYQKILKLSALLKSFAVDPKVCFQPAIKNNVRLNQAQPSRVKGSLITNVIKFGPMFQNSFMATSIGKAIQVLGHALSRRPLEVFLNFQPASVQQQAVLGSISSGFNSTDVTKSSSSHMKVEEQVLFEEKSQPDSMCGPSVIHQNHKINEEKPQVLLPHIQAVFPENINPKTFIICGRGDDAQLQHQKLTSSQLLQFLRIKSKNKDSPEAHLFVWAQDIYETGSSATVMTQTYQLRSVAADKMMTPPPKALHGNIDNQTPVFRVKSASASRTLTYSFVTETETEIWDIGEINSAVTKMPTPISVKIPEFQFWRFGELEVVVSHIVSPDNLYIQHADSSEKLQALVTDNCKASRSYAEQNCIPDIGTQVIGWFPQKKEWCRAQVMKICGVSRDKDVTDGAGIESSIKVEVKRLDYGDTSCLSLWNMKELTQEMAVLPLQALHVSLANVVPVNGGHWSEDAVGWIKAMVHKRMLYARVYPQAPTVTVELFLERGKLGAMRRGASLSLRLAQNGHATHNNLKNAACIIKNPVQRKTHERGSDWEKYLISCYTQMKK